MKRFAGLFAVLSALVAGAAMAEVVGVRSGEHEGFTRLVIDFEKPEDWVFGRVDGGFEFRPDRPDTTYRLDRVFDKIGRTRIEDVRDLGEGRLLLGVSCNCHAEVDELANGKVVLDITTGPPPALGAGFDAELPPFDPRQSGQREGADIVTAAPGGSKEQAPAPVLVSDRSGLPLTLPLAPPPLDLPGIPSEQGPEQLAGPRGQGDSEQATGTAVIVADGAQDTAPVSNGDAVRAERIARTEEALLEQVARAAAQGLLDADLSDIEENVARTKPASGDVAPAPMLEPPSAPVTYRGHVSVETSIDRAAAGPERQSRETDDGGACIAPEFFDIGSWGDEIGQGIDLGTYRSRFVTELDVADGDGVSALVRNYIYMTFGAEAKALIRRYPESLERPDLLYMMAEVMDEGMSKNAAQLVDQLPCEGATALWAALAQPEIKVGQTLNRDAISVAFNALPPHLRRHLGPRLADSLLKAGDLETADLIRSAIDRAGAAPTSEYGMLTAQFDLQAGKVDEATAALDDVVATGDAVLPEALLQRVEATLSEGGAVADDMLVLLDSLAFQFRGTDTARQMVDAAVRARASAGEFRAAFEQLDAAEDANMFSPDRSAAVRAGLFERVTRDADDTEFLRLALTRLEDIAASPAETRRALASRLLDLGFSGPVRQALGDGNAIPEPADRLLLARAALVETRPEVAIGYLAGLDEPEAQVLRAEALEMAGDHAGALRAYEAAGDRDRMLRAAWRGEQWPEVAQLDQGPVGAAAQLMLMMNEPTSGTSRVAGAAQPSLAIAQALIDESEAARQAVKALLDEIPPPTDDAVVSQEVPSF